jgi:archaellum component FlaC
MDTLDGQFANVDENDSHMIHLDDAYEALLATRAEPVIPGFTTSGQSLTEEELLCTTNLHTASLFKTLNSKYKDYSKAIELYNDRIKELHDSVYKIELSYQEIKDRTLEYDNDSLQDISNSFETFHKNILKAKTTIIESIKKRKDSVEKEMEDLSRKLNAIRSLILTGVNEIIKSDDVPKKMCPVCFDNEVCMALVPCGHTYCRGCADMDRSRSAKCPQCRSAINARVKIFFSV